MRVFGINSISDHETAKAEFVLPVPMGSPQNYYGVGFFEGAVPGPATPSTPRAPSWSSSTAPVNQFATPANGYASDNAYATGTVGQGIERPDAGLRELRVDRAGRRTPLTGIVVSVEAKSIRPSGLPARRRALAGRRSHVDHHEQAGRPDRLGSGGRIVAECRGVDGPVGPDLDVRADSPNGTFLVRLRAYDPEPANDPENNKPNVCNNTRSCRSTP